MHNITTDLGSGIIEVEASGFWTLEHVEDFLRDLEREARRVLATGKRHMLLCNFSKSAIQPQEVIAMLQRVAVSMPLKSRRVALYTEGKLARLQVKRIASVRDDMAVFDDREAALTWMLGEASVPPDATATPPSS
ncbi:STAS/SEC14 domain-containing protein [Sphingomonas faeni]|uniref:STAS/SEC14 domain-containing protein n=1 Tax=Sphingomonas faeni TaxID=185950 RepID=UPI003348A464